MRTSAAASQIVDSALRSVLRRWPNAAATIRANSSPNMTGIGYTLLRLFDAQCHALGKSFLTKGRIDDSLIGFPRKSRGVTNGTQ